MSNKLLTKDFNKISYSLVEMSKTRKGVENIIPNIVPEIGEMYKVVKVSKELEEAVYMRDTIFLVRVKGDNQ